MNELLKPYQSDKILQKHQASHQKIEKDEFQCSLCNKSLTTERFLKNHYAMHSRNESFVCKVCDKKFGRKAYLQNHTRTHTGERPFKCQECNKTFNQNSNLKTHVRTTHRLEKKYQCSICPSSFTRRRLLLYHSYSNHTDQNLFECSYCDKGFNYPQLFKKHVLSCKSKPTDEFYNVTNGEDDKHLVRRIGSTYYIAENSQEYIEAICANLEQQNMVTGVLINNIQQNTDKLCLPSNTHRKY